MRLLFEGGSYLLISKSSAAFIRRRLLSEGGSQTRKYGTLKVNSLKVLCIVLKHRKQVIICYIFHVFTSQI